MSKLIVIALGGNALLRAGEKGTITEQERNAYETCLNLLPLIKAGHNIVITHGNGPQVGNILLQNQAGAKLYGIPEMPLDVCGAYSQGFIGYIIEQQLRNVLETNGIEKDVLTLITEVLVDKNDPAFQNPTKPIGPYYTKEEAEKIMQETGSIFKEDPKGRGWRKVVASPKPLKIGNRKSIEKLAREGNIVIAVGGGGIPVYFREDGKLEGIDAVIDKDLASALLATQIHADQLIILTDVPKVYLNFNKPNQKALDVLTIEEAQKYLEEGHFASGSMGPKVQACINFILNGGEKAIITETTQVNNPEAGTVFVKK
ncbi:MAG: carbamate kinase [Bacteroidales bacterium]|nr:carbamate kinase [Bacteroidales bacterium]